MILTTFSECGTYRYTLLRSWGDMFARRKRIVNFVMLNPSTADEYADDPTVRKCVKLAKLWGYDALYVTNLFAYRSTDKSVLKKVADPIGPENDHYIEEIAIVSDLVVAAWGQDGVLLDRANAVRKLLRPAPLMFLRMSAEPWHPLYLPDNSKPLLWEQ